MEIEEALNVVNKALKELPEKMTSDMAKVMLLAIGLQESEFKVRRQYGNGPAKGFWQFERGGGVNGVLSHTATKDLAAKVLKSRGIPASSYAVWDALETDDALAAIFARLLLWSDAGKLPTAADTGWDTYYRTWRPGKPHPDKWPANFAKALSVVQK